MLLGLTSLEQGEERTKLEMGIERHETALKKGRNSLKGLPRVHLC